ncbi:acyl carrier protein [Anaerobranca californiensis DSM 14826]|uniref:Acyl carrier protein n=1 Tax=Anaerobranca californiensis DSM 14826 TaxID=1120989 RepID=A0A1M6KN14_9FIRM|nr:acyl carrier protein [Anaerobranca californiensis]SHJ60311.1 acyl carrier protein [Anaerobranca californiensis DSM 14826]
MSVFDRVKKIIVEHTNVSEDVVTLDASFQDDLDLDSLDIMDLLMVFEEEFDVQIPDEELQKIKTVGDVVNYINE